MEQAWADVHANTPQGWSIGQPGWEKENHRWSMYAFDPTERPFVGKRSREWTALGETELDCVRRMAYCLGELKAGRWPK